MRKLEPVEAIIVIAIASFVSYLPIIAWLTFDNVGWLLVYPMFIAAIMIYLRLTD